MKLFTPPGAPSWLDPLLRRIRQGLAEPWDSPLRLKSIATASLPTAADYPAGLVYDSTTAGVKFSNGTVWASVGGGGGSLTDGDKGDITVSGSGATWTIDAGVVSLSKMANVATGTVFYRKTAATGVPEVQTLATLKTDLGLTGTNSGDQTITLTGDVTGSGTGSFAATVGNGVVTLAKMANIATASFIGRVTAGTGVPEALTGTQATTLLDTFTSGLKGLAPASGGGTSNFLRADGTWAAPSGGGGVSDGDKGDITVSGSGATWTIDAGVVTLTKMADVATGTVFYRKTAATGVPEVQTLATLKTDLGLTGTNSGDQTITLTGDVTGTGTGSFAATIGNGTVTLAKMANLAANSIIGNNTGSAATPIALTAAQVKALLAVAQADVTGLTTADSPQFAAVNVGHATDTTLARVAAGRLSVEGSGLVRGPSSATDGAVVMFDSTTGDLVRATGTPSLPAVTGLAGAIGPAIADYFTSTISLAASSTYEIECVAFFLKTTAGTVVFTWTFTGDEGPITAGSFYTGTPATGYTTTTITGAQVTGEAHVRSSGLTLAHAATASLTTAVYHSYRFRVHLVTNVAGTIQLRATSSAGTITPQTGSYMRATKII